MTQYVTYQHARRLAAGESKYRLELRNNLPIRRLNGTLLGAENTHALKDLHLEHLSQGKT